jgi:ubiquinone/menaquinone biosynthesis C-methylase UbiE
MSRTTESVKSFSDFAEFYKKGNAFTTSIAAYGLTVLPPLTPNSIVHDNASGPGVVSFAIADAFANNVADLPRIYGTDLAPGMIELMEKEIVARGLQDKISAAILDSRHLEGFGDGKFTHSITNFAIMTDDAGADKIASEIYRTLQPGGAAMVTSWEHSAVELVDRVSRRIRPNHDPVRVISPEWATKEKLVGTLITGGFQEAKIEVYSRDSVVEYESEKDRLAYFTHPFWGMWRKGWSEKEEELWDGVMGEELLKVAGTGRMFSGKAWVAVARK